MTVSGSTPYPWPYDGVLVPERCALVICGSGPTWSQRCPFDDRAESNIEHLRAVSTDLGALVVLLRHDPPSAREPFAVDEVTAPVLHARGSEIEIKAAGINGFYASRLDRLLQGDGRDQLLFAGRGFETAVHSTLRSANDRGYECLTVVDACADIDPGCRGAAISTIEMSGGIFGAVGATADVVSAIQSTNSEAPS